MAYIETIDFEDATGQLKEIYNEVISNRGKLAEVHKIQSLNPTSIINHQDFYLTIMYGRSSLKRYQRELIAVIVSVANKCAYCQVHHKLALNHFWKDEDRVNSLATDFTTTKLSEEDRVLADYAYDLTLKPHCINEEEHIQSLKEVGFDDRAILDVAMIVSYFNFVNRMILGLGVELEENASGYNYN